MKSIHAIVFGVVQGVGFRNFVQKTAEKNHLYGWVRNRKDGTVEIAAEGEKTSIEQFVQTVKTGSAFSHVERVEIEDDADIQHDRQFSIRG
ncbi:acylphosphatase [Salicibibacter cibarius]|uniref:Acylphosphatase n=1 Tax=Salicibibacter cibarius TaxID=2743000 RepID=A0A7T7CB84_9BACI|nr:acylphosphatase [Salicibibacter cibarius]QQK75603.1 acylphosphatase [Salicibibacter cibarius]